MKSTKSIYLNTCFRLFCGISTVFALSGCGDFLETESKSTFTSDVVFSSTTYVNYAITGIYTAIPQNDVYMNFYFPFNTDIEYQNFSTGNTSDNERRSIGNYLINAGNQALAGGGRPWGNYYKGIERANLCIKEIRNSSLLTEGTTSVQALMKAYLGEALTLRAYLYTLLVINWGDIPFKTDPTQPDGSNFSNPKTDRDDIYDYLITDLQEAIELLPWLKDSETGTPERVSKGFAKGLLARICLYRGGYSFRTSMKMERGSNWQYYYGIAAQQCREIIDNGTHRLNPSYANIWKTLCKLDFDRTYNENLMEIGFTMSYSGDNGYIAGWKYVTSDKYGYQTQSGIMTTPAYLYSFHPKDSRRLVSVGVASYDATPKQVIIQNPASLTIGKWNRKWMTDAYLTLMKSASGKILTGVNWVPMRMADVYLMLAEADNALGQSMDEARVALKTVRARAFADADDLTKAAMVDAYVDGLAAGDDFFNAVVNERAWEFGGEAIRKYDLIRWNLLLDKIMEMRQNNLSIVNRTYPYDYIPNYLFYRYDDNDPEEIDYATLNLDTDKGDSDISGFNRVPWYPMKAWTSTATAQENYDG
ncbi:MAG: RagB/SusD family nutrient uptake outer membrane protein, partial [Bacteroidales bacterium]|nr:RagB/SusD family nutrient uptake outer membrane protein [Bacteroidales bacterium]